MKKKVIYLVALLLALSLTSCKNRIEKEISFLTFNIWQEGTSVSNGLEKIRDVIIKTNPDIVCFTEVRNYNNQDWTTKIVNALTEEGLHYHRGYVGGDVSFISKYPLENGKLIYSTDGTVVNFDVNIEGNYIVVSGAHLDYTYYASNLPRGYSGGDPDWKIIDNGQGNPLPKTELDSIQTYNLKSQRDEAIKAFLDSTKANTNPIILMGDFNEPSWLDWTEKTKDRFDHNGLTIPWKNTKKLYESGFTDAYRTFYPDEMTNPGFTWPSFAHGIESTSWSPLADERDRIDYIFYKGNQIELKGVSIVGPKASYVYNKLDTSNTNNENFLAEDLDWPSDHKAVFAKLSFTLDKK